VTRAEIFARIDLQCFWLQAWIKERARTDQVGISQMTRFDHAAKAAKRRRVK
jgi:hypothetical protein